MTDVIVSRTERRQRRERRRIGFLGLGVMVACLAATVVVLLLTAAHGQAGVSLPLGRVFGS
jgi:Tfp pilus assembly protein PilN